MPRRDVGFIAQPLRSDGLPRRRRKSVRRFGSG